MNWIKRGINLMMLLVLFSSLFMFHQHELGYLEDPCPDCGVVDTSHMTEKEKMTMFANQVGEGWQKYL